MPVQARRQIREITSSTNALLKVFRRALKEGLTREGWLAVEGPLLLKEALHGARADKDDEKFWCASSVRSVLVAHGAAGKFDELLAQLPSDAEATRIPDRLFQQVSQTVSPQGIAALVEVQPPRLDSVLARSGVVLLVACGLQDPGNLGTILRSAEAFGASALLTLTSTVSPFNPKVVRSCGGAIFRLPVFSGWEAGPLFELLRQDGLRVVAADPHSHVQATEADLRGPLALLIGNEAAGLAKEILQEAALSLSIPIRAGVDSINAAVSASILLYEAARQRAFRY